MVARQIDPWLGFEVGTQSNVVRMEERKVEKGLRPCEEIFESRPGAPMPARALLATVSYLNFLQWVVPGGFCHLRSGFRLGPVEVRFTRGKGQCRHLRGTA